MEVSFELGPNGGVLWVDAEADGQSISLGGYCRYWAEDDSFGGFNCLEHPEVGFVSYRWTDERFIREYRMPTLGEIFVGEWLSDSDWRKVRR